MWSRSSFAYSLDVSSWLLTALYCKRQTDSLVLKENCFSFQLRVGATAELMTAPLQSLAPHTAGIKWSGWGSGWRFCTSSWLDATTLPACTHAYTAVILVWSFSDTMAVSSSCIQCRYLNLYLILAQRIKNICSCWKR